MSLGEARRGAPPPGGTDVRIDVHDTSHHIPELRAATDAQPGGFGLRIVGDLSNSWGWIHTPTGKVVWSIISCVR